MQINEMSIGENPNRHCVYSRHSNQMTENQETTHATRLIGYSNALLEFEDVEDLDASVTAVLWRALEMQLKMQGMDIEMLLMARDGS